MEKNIEAGGCDPQQNDGQLHNSKEIQFLHRFGIKLFNFLYIFGGLVNYRISDPAVLVNLGDFHFKLIQLHSSSIPML